MNQIISTNKKAEFDFNIEKKLEVGVELKGWEVKSIRIYGVSLNNTYIFIKNGEMFWRDASIKNYIGNSLNLDSKKDRKILIHKKQLYKWYGEMTKNSMTIIVLEAYWKNHRYFKLSIGLASKSKKFDKKEKIKTRDIIRSINQEYKLN